MEYSKIYELMRARHSVRSYSDKPIGDDVIRELNDEIAACNREGGLHIQLVKNEPLAFDGFMAHYGKFDGVKNYIALIGKKGAGLDEACGYYGERLVLKLQQLGMNSCWVAMTYKKIPGAFKIGDGERLTVVIAFGYGKTQGVAHTSKPASSVSNVDGASPEWFKRGVEAALLAPTAMNQQKFGLRLADKTVYATAGFGFYTKLDLGIVKYHFELAAGKENFIWGK